VEQGENMDEILAQFEKNATEVVRVSLREYRGRQLIDVRVYYSDDEGEYRPTKKGVSLTVEGYPEFKKAIAVLEKALLDRKLVTPEELEDVSVAEVDES
jgi:hypothetical protein